MYKQTLESEAIRAANKLHREGEMTDRPTTGVSVNRWRAMIDSILRNGPPSHFRDVPQDYYEGG